MDDQLDANSRPSATDVARLTELAFLWRLSNDMLAEATKRNLSAGVKGRIQAINNQLWTELLSVGNRAFP